MREPSSSTFYFIFGRPWSKWVRLFWWMSMPLTILLFGSVEDERALRIIYLMVPTPWMGLSCCYVWDIFMWWCELVDEPFKHPEID
jgi:hypothetical protein